MSGNQWLWLFLVQSTWAGSYLAMKAAGSQMPVGIVVFLRYGITALGFLLIWSFRGFPRFRPKEMLLLGSIGVLNFALAPSLQVASLQLTQAIDVSIMIAFEPMITVLVAALWARERPSRKTSIALGAATLGMFLLSGVFEKSGGSGLSSPRFIGNAIFLSSLICEAIVSVGGRTLSQDRRPSDLIGGMMLAGFLGGAAWNFPAIVSFDYFSIQPSGWVSILYLAFACSIFAYTVWYRIIRVVPVARVALSLFIQPLVGTLLGLSLLGEKVGLQTVAGAWLIIASLIWWQRKLYPAISSQGQNKSDAPLSHT